MRYVTLEIEILFFFFFFVTFVSFSTSILMHKIGEILFAFEKSDFGKLSKLNNFHIQVYKKDITNRNGEL